MEMGFSRKSVEHAVKALGKVLSLYCMSSVWGYIIQANYKEKVSNDYKFF